MKLKNIIYMGLALCVGFFSLCSCNSLYNPSESHNMSGVTELLQQWSEEEIEEIDVDSLEYRTLLREKIGLYEARYEFLDERMRLCYAYHTLNKYEKIWYLDMYQIIKNMKENVALYNVCLKELDEENLDKIYQCLVMDHPEFFYLEGYRYIKYMQGNHLIGVTFTGTYTMDSNEVQERQDKIDAYTEECLAGISIEADEYEKTKYIYDYIVLNTEFNEYAKDTQNICSVFIEKESVCLGYAKAVQYLLNKLNVYATTVLGYVENGNGHAWNLVQIDNEYYYVDSTWGDASYQQHDVKGEMQKAPSINYDYLCVTTEQLLKTHEILSIVDLPLCRHTEANYFVREGAYFTKFDEEELTKFYERELENGKTCISIKCSNHALFQKMKEHLVEEQAIFRYMYTVEDTILYLYNENQLTLTFWTTTE